MVGQNDEALRGARAGGRGARADGECGGDGRGAHGDGGGVGGLVEGGGGDEEGGLIRWLFKGVSSMNIARPGTFFSGVEGVVISVMSFLSPCVVDLLQYTPWISWLCTAICSSAASFFCDILMIMAWLLLLFKYEIIYHWGFSL